MGRRDRKKRFRKKKDAEKFQQKCCGIPFNNRVSYMQHVREKHPWRLGVQGL